MYNIAKVAKGEILIFFNDVFDALCKVRIINCCVCSHAEQYKARRRFGIVREERG